MRLVSIAQNANAELPKNDRQHVDSDPEPIDLQGKEITQILKPCDDVGRFRSGFLPFLRPNFAIKINKLDFDGASLENPFDNMVGPAQNHQRAVSLEAQQPR